ncbi:Hypp3098 [Branchiostoma lanceolatum]|uniref:Hypp3098 protein n=1 Tax=Branchiostoma lanceolatum TaxID=7740 RepID=A0A8J9ZWJ8_BRALA|nr:Hypp3098 [Branchiostoma lanceolatum]
MAEAIPSGVVPGDTTDSFSGNSTRPAAAPTRTRNTVLVGAAAKHTRFQVRSEHTQPKSDSSAVCLHTGPRSDLERPAAPVM